MLGRERSRTATAITPSVINGLTAWTARTHALRLSIASAEPWARQVGQVCFAVITAWLPRVRSSRDLSSNRNS